MADVQIAYDFAQDVLNDKIMACRFVRLACQRFLDDLKNGHKRGLYFDEDAANHRLQFYQFCRHFEGEYAGQIIEPTPIQVFVKANVYGWKKKGGYRRFNYAWIEVGRKFGKSTDVATDGNYLLLADNEPGAKIFTAAALDLNVLLPTPTGWTSVRDVRVGDQLFDENGKSCNVIYITEIFNDHECYEIEFDDGQKIIADAGHLWQTTARKTYTGNKGSCKKPKLRCEDGRKAVFSLHRKTYYVCHWEDPGKKEKFKQKLSEILKESPLRHTTTSIRTTEEIYKTQHWEYANRGLRANHSVELAKKLNLPEKQFALDPYILGLWLGDGKSNRGSITTHIDDSEEIIKTIKSRGYSVSPHWSPNNQICFTVLNIRKYLRQLNLINNKHIPQEYLRSAYSQRLDLLQGLMDTDGTCTKTGECRFANRKIRLAQGVYELATSVGIKAHISVRIVTGRPHYIVSFKAYTELPVFKLKRKCARQKKKPSKKTQNIVRYITKVTKIDSVPVKCIEVDSKSHLFLAGQGMIPTHNTKKDQAAIIHNASVRMVKKSPSLAKRIGISKLGPKTHHLHVESTASTYEPIGKDSNTEDGLNVHGALIDEIHAHKDAGIWGILDSATGSRRQPLIIVVTTAGFNQQSIGYELHKYSQEVLKDPTKDDSWFAIICTLDLKKDWPDLQTAEEHKQDPNGTQEDNWTDESCWVKANPNLGITPYVEDLRKKAKKAIAIPSEQNNFITKHCNVWTQQENRWLDLALWDSNFSHEIREEYLRGRKCFGGLDLSAVSDLSAWVMLFPDRDDFEKIDVLARFWCPEAKLHDKRNRYKNFYQAWAKEAWVNVTSGDAIDYQYIKTQILQDASIFQVDSINVDRLFQGYQLSMELADEGIEILPMGMGYLSMAGPMNEFESRLLKKKINHGGNPVLRFMADNLVVSTDPAGNRKPNKADSQGKIDGIVAILLALDRCMRNHKKTSVYEERGLLFV